MKEFLRKMFASAVVTSCIIFGFFGVCEAYSGIRKIGFGEERYAIEIGEEGISIFDFLINNKQ